MATGFFLAAILTGADIHAAAPVVALVNQELLPSEDPEMIAAVSSERQEINILRAEEERATLAVERDRSKTRTVREKEVRAIKRRFIQSRNEIRLRVRRNLRNKAIRKP